MIEDVVGDDVLELDVQAMLNGVDLEGTRRSLQTTDRLTDALRLFYSYAHEDGNLRDALETHLKILHRRGLIAPWYDRKIDAGDEWKLQIDEHLERADIILLLVSADFIASDYCWDIEMVRALERHEAGEACIIPVIVRDVNWHKAPFGRLQALPPNGLAVDLWPNRDTAWRQVSEGIERVIARRLDQTRRPRG